MDQPTFLAQINKTNPKNLAEIESVITLAQKVYANNTCSWGESMLSHSLNVANDCLNQNLDLNTIKLAILHDIGLFIKESEIDKLLPKEKTLVRLIKNYTAIKSLVYKVNDKHTTISLTTKLLLSTSNDIRILIVKLFDKLEDLENYENLPPSEKKRLLNRIKRIYSPLADFIGMAALKRKFDDLAFMVENPSEYQKIKQVLKKYEDPNYHKSFKKRLVNLLASQNLRPIKIFGRTKGIYSTYEKTIRGFGSEIPDKSNVPLGFIDQIADKYGTTILLPTVEDCYKAFNLIKGKFEKVPRTYDNTGRDYIANPRPNGYRSLHIRMFTDQRKKIQTEIQIKTPEMHLFNEYGPASHIAYKVKIVFKEDLDKDLYVFDKLQQWKDNPTDKRIYKLNLFKDSIFVFTPKSDVIRLSKDATPIDFAYKIHTKVGEHCGGAKINGIMSKISDTLKTGDIVQIITTKKPNVRKDWLKIAKDTETLSQIRKSLRNLETGDRAT
ncbi:bifunctional (p)ppGpp synthetase/guanosine-3',5'-bis(diphosphate) 3'-pyrophosphohydrolase [Candidatus Dojkabacteria bacterium]|nr:bifunctional (p)ppGpp synthetase/guanosine-3',5'-bis(diphosphate) 3'-pyrophosphohydrolase [Candidatus Dojkabacteria bacterium]